MVTKKKPASKSRKKLKNNPERYSNIQKVSAILIGFFGISLIISNLNMTGAVIGGTSTFTSGIIGIFMIFFSLLLYLRPLKKTFNK